MPWFPYVPALRRDASMLAVVEARINSRPRPNLQTMTALTAAHEELAAALRERIAVIGDRDARDRDPASHLRRLQEVSERIVALQGALPAPVHPQLAHYLERCSYDKALAFLEGKP